MLVRVAADERFLRDGSDLVTVVDVPAPAAALGHTVTVPTLDGDEELDVPAGTQPGTVVTLRGRGMPAIGRGRRGRNPQAHHLEQRLATRRDDVPVVCAEALTVGEERVEPPDVVLPRCSALGGDM